MDEIDVKLLQLLSKDANATTNALKKEVNLSLPAINKRVKNLKKDGVIKQSTIITDSKKVGKPITAFVLIVLKSIEHLGSFLEYANSDNDILECFAVTGEYDCILKVCASSVDALDKKLALLKTHNGVMKSYTMLSLTAHKYTPTFLP